MTSDALLNYIKDLPISDADKAQLVLMINKEIEDATIYVEEGVRDVIYSEAYRKGRADGREAGWSDGYQCGLEEGKRRYSPMRDMRGSVIRI